ncbi:MAG TPA: hypothetical protein VEG34_19425 [Thermoanaerobaculia bacterium]|nr:hypothetical protein [Thermoanaerobaculia bacterium]
MERRPAGGRSGGDVFVVRNDGGELHRIQVKTATAKEQHKSHFAQFRVALTQLRTPREPDLVYVFALRLDSRWGPFLVIDRDALRIAHEEQGVGSPSDGAVTFRVTYTGSSIRCSDRDFLAYRDDWSRWPVLLR